MKHLIIYAHPNTESLNHFLKQYVADLLSDQNHEVEIRDLYAINFNPVLSIDDLQGQRQGTVAGDVQTEQEWIGWADCITIVHPIWWTGLPAMMKGYIDRVFSYNFAYSYDHGVQKGLLVGKKCVVLNTHGKSHDEYYALGMDQAFSLVFDTGIYKYCGLELKKHLFIDQADRMSAEHLHPYLLEIEKIYSGI